MPTNYYIIIDDSVGRYGQLYGKNISGVTNVNFNIDPSSIINLSNYSSKSYPNVLNGITAINRTGKVTIKDKIYKWSIDDTNTLKVSLEKIHKNDLINILSILVFLFLIKKKIINL